MSPPKILQLASVSPGFDARLAALAASLSTAVLTPWRDPDALDKAANIELVATTARRGCEAALIEKLPDLKAIAMFGVGLDAIALDLAREKNIAVSSTPGLLDDCVADCAFGLLLTAARRLAEGDRFIRAGRWAQGGLPHGLRVSGKRLGILGLGKIGKLIARRAVGFDMAIGYHNRHADPQSPAQYFASVEALAEFSDFLVVATPGGAATEKLVGAAALKALGPGGFLINIARGSVVDEAALLDALTQKTIAGAALDVFAREPGGADAFAGLDNVVLTPHIGSATVETRQKMEDRLLANIAAFFTAGRLENPVF